MTSAYNHDKTLIVVVDHDGCSSAECLTTLQINMPFILYLFQEIKTKNITRVVFMIGSNRQCYDIDRVNEITNLNKNPRVVIPIIMTELMKMCFEESVSCMFIFDKMITADAHNDRPAGHNHRTLYAEKLKTPFDEQKAAMMTHLVSYITETYNPSMSANIDIQFLDDRGDLLESVTDTIRQLQHIILPVNTTFTAIGMVVDRDWIPVEDGHLRSDLNDYTVHCDIEYVKECKQLIRDAFRTTTCQKPTRCVFPITHGSATVKLDSRRVWKELSEKFSNGDRFTYDISQLVSTIESMD